MHGPNDIKKLLGKEVVVIAGDDTAFTKIRIYGNVADAGECLKMRDSETNYDIKAYHGVLSTGEVLPSELDGKECYVMIIHSSYFFEGGWRGYVYPVETDDDVEELAKEIENAIGDKTPHIYGVRIEDIYVLYGYKLQLGLCINEDLFDEEAIETCKHIVKEVETIKKKYA